MADLDLLGTYLNEIGPFPIITREQEADLVLKLRAGDDQARTQLIYSNLKLVVTIAKQFVNSGFELYDLIQEGNKGLVEAANDYVKKEGTTFKSYADDCVRNQIISLIRKKKQRQQSLSLDLDDGLAENTPDKQSPSPELEAENLETSFEVQQVLNKIPSKIAISKFANGYRVDELEKSQRQEVYIAFRLLAHPSRSRELSY